MKKNSLILVKPHLTEKASILQERQHTYVFKVLPIANKMEIKQAVEGMFAVKVSTVNVGNFNGKLKRVGSRRGRTNDWKKAYVTLSEGEINYTDEL
ncbi:MAG TPA: 50S ribosomal protein L23 [Desulfobulbaceae bacterium]|nr:50S ribosomal protein L23 [Desulfobulbaceae bacterium]